MIVILRWCIGGWSIENQKNEIITIKNNDHVWVEGQDQVAKVVMDSLLDIYYTNLGSNHGEEIDLTLRYGPNENKWRRPPGS